MLYSAKHDISIIASLYPFNINTCCHRYLGTYNTYVDEDVYFVISSNLLVNHLHLLL